MKILLDESLPRKLKADFDIVHQVKTVRDMGWLGKKNGERMGLLTLEKFEAFVTFDRNLSFQQNLPKYDVVIFLLSSNDSRYVNLKPLIKKNNILIEAREFKKFNEIN